MRTSTKQRKASVCEGGGRSGRANEEVRKDSEHMRYNHGLVVNYKVIKPSILNVSLQHSGGGCQGGKSNFQCNDPTIYQNTGRRNPKAEIFFATLVNTSLLSLLASSNRRLSEL